jgi:hypothetical protein
MNYGFSLEPKDRDYGKKYFGKYRGIVTENDDPLKMGRVKAQCPKVFGRQGETDWALPCLPPGFKKIPEIGDFIWLEFEDGDARYPIWTGVWFTQDGFQVFETGLVIAAKGIVLVTTEEQPITMFGTNVSITTTGEAGDGVLTVNERQPLAELDNHEARITANEGTLSNHESRISSLE